MSQQANGPVLLTTHVIGDVNRSRVLQAFVHHGALSRADLARLAGVPRATMGTIVASLLDAELVEELSPDRDGRVGKPGRPLWFGPRAGLSVAVGFETDRVRAALVNARGERLTDNATVLRTAEATSAQLRASVERAVNAVLPHGEPVMGIGIAVPGVCDTRAGEVVASGQLPGSVGTILTTALRQRFGVPILVDNDARAQALGEQWFGQARGTATFASVQTGSGLGIGLVLGGRLYRGEDGRVGELGHTTLVVEGGETCRCGLRGCWETVATLRWLRAQASLRGLPRPNATTTASLFQVNSSPALALVEEYARHLAAGIATLVNLLGVRTVIVHGDANGGGEPMRLLLETALRAATLGYLSDEVTVVLSELDADAALLGAAALVLSETFQLAV